MKNEDIYEESAPVNDTEENATKVKKKKNRVSYSKYAFIRLNVNEKYSFTIHNFCCVLVFSSFRY